MNTDLPTAEQVRKALQELTLKQITHLAELSGASEPTLIKIRYGQTENPRLDTVGEFWPYVEAAKAFKEEPTEAA